MSTSQDSSTDVASKRTVDHSVAHHDDDERDIKAAAQHNKLKSQSFKKLYWTQSLPNLLASSWYQIMYAVMIIIMSRTDPGLTSSYGFANPVVRFINGLGLLISRGLNTSISFFMGQKRTDLAEQAVADGLYLVFIVYAIVLVCFYPSINKLVPVLGAPEAARHNSDLYGHIMVASSILITLSMYTNGILRSQGFPKFVLYGMITASIMAAILCYLLVMVGNYGIIGYSISFLASPTLLVIFNFGFIIFNKNIPIKIRLRKPSKLILRIVKGGLSSAVNQMAGVCQVIIMNEGIVYIARGPEGNLVAGTMASTMTLTAVIMFTGTTLAMNATLPIANFTRATGDYQKFRQINLYGLKMSFLVIFLMCSLILCLCTVLPKAYYDDPIDVKYMNKCIWIVFSGRAFYSPAVSIIEIFQSSGLDFWATLISINRNVFVTSTILIIMTFTTDNIWLFLAGQPIGDLIATSISLLIMFIFRKRLYLTKSACEAKERELAEVQDMEVKI